MRPRFSLLIASLFCMAACALADEITYVALVNTGILSGTTGYLDFQFNPGPFSTQSASAEIQNFTAFTGSLGGSPTVTGDVTGGPLPATLVIGNSTGFNDYFEQVTFGSFIVFDLHLTGSALVSPDGTSASGSSFGFGMFADEEGTQPLLTTDPFGFALIVDVNLDGSTTALTFPSDSQGGPPAVLAAPVPEPESLLLLVFVITALGCLSRVFSPRRASPVTGHGGGC